MASVDEVDTVVQDLIASAIPKIGNRGIIVVVWGDKDTCYRANIKPELVPTILTALADKLAPVQKDGSRTYIVQPNGDKKLVPPPAG